MNDPNPDQQQAFEQLLGRILAISDEQIDALFELLQKRTTLHLGRFGIQGPMRHILESRLKRND